MRFTMPARRPWPPTRCPLRTRRLRRTEIAPGSGGGCAGGDDAARTYAECIDPETAHLLDRAVAGGREERIAYERVIADAVDDGLRVLEANAHGEIFPLDGDAFFLEQREDVARGVAGGENEPLAAELFVAGENDITGVDFEF